MDKVSGRVNSGSRVLSGLTGLTRLMESAFCSFSKAFVSSAVTSGLVGSSFFITTSLLLISKFPSYSFKKIVIQRKATIFLLFGIVLFFGLLLIYPFNMISISVVVYLMMLPVSFFHYQKLKKQNQDKDFIEEDDDLEDVL